MSIEKNIWNYDERAALSGHYGGKAKRRPSKVVEMTEDIEAMRDIERLPSTPYRVHKCPYCALHGTIEEMSKFYTKRGLSIHMSRWCKYVPGGL